MIFRKKKLEEKESESLENQVECRTALAKNVIKTAFKVNNWAFQNLKFCFAKV